MDIATVLILVCFFTAIGMVLLYTDPPNADSKDLDRQAIGDAWQIQEISNSARRQMYREAKRHGWGGGG